MLGFITVVSLAAGLRFLFQRIVRIGSMAVQEQKNVVDGTLISNEKPSAGVRKLRQLIRKMNLFILLTHLCTLSNTLLNISLTE